MGMRQQAEGSRQEIASKRTLALFEIILMLTLTFTISLSLSSKDVQAAQVCCEKTKGDNPRYCEQVDESECAADSQRAPTSCEQTSFCRGGCCASQDGYCYSNYPKALCSSSGIDGRFYAKENCDAVNECKVGCCVIGNQAVYITKSRCIAETAVFGDLEVDFREGIKSEQECLDLARTAEVGCCVTESGCKYGAKATCDVKTTVNGTGFYKDKYCSQLPNLCKCAPANPEIQSGNIEGSGNPKSTMCVNWDDSVYWRDSCGNPEGQVNNKKCDYSQGTLCGDSDNDGEYTCERLDCKPGEKGRRALSVDMKDAEDGKATLDALNRNRILNGESWCLWDYATAEESKTFYGHDPVGATHYRSLCINGQELIEPCADFRKEYCFSSDIEVSGVRQKTGGEILAARCLKNDKWQSCVNECNTADPFKMNEKEYADALENDIECCTDISHRDCQWVGSKCTPAVKPGYKFWEGEGTDTCGKGNLECTATFVCPGWDSVLGTCKPADKGWRTAKVIGGMVLAGIIGAVTGGTGVLLISAAGGASAFGVVALMNGDFEITKTGGWALVSGGECFSKDYLQASNNYCRSLGDCGADYNWNEQLSLDGFTNTGDVDDQFKEVILDYGSKGVFNVIQKSHKNTKIPAKAGSDLEKSLQYIDKVKSKSGGEIPGSLDTTTSKPNWEKGREFFDFFRKESDKKGFLSRFFNKNSWGKGWTNLGTSFLGVLAVEGIGIALIESSFLGTVALGAVTNVVPGLTSLIGWIGGGETKTVLLQATDKVALEKAIVANAEKLVADEVKNMPLAQLQARAESELGTRTVSQVRQAIPGGVETVEGKSAFGKALEKKLVENAGKGASIKSAQNLASFLSGINVGMWVYTGYHLIDSIATDVKSVSISTQCKPWQSPPVEKEDQCERCNPNFVDKEDATNSYVDEKGNPLSVNAFKKCTEYRCKSLGASCELINKGTTKEMCVSLFRFDVNPPKIDPWKEGITKELQDRISKEGFQQPGFGIKGEPIKEYTRFNLAIKTDKPSQCKMSLEHGKKYEEMSTTFFGGNLYDYFHIQPIFYAASKNKTVEDTLAITADVGKPKEHKLYVRCQDSQGNANLNDYVITFTVGGAPDITVPTIFGTSIGEEAYITSGQEEVKLNLFVSEPADCKYDFTNVQYKDMKGGSCITSGVDSLGFYSCKFTGDPGAGASIKGIKSKGGEVKYVYFKCQDNSKNFNKEAFRLILRGSDPLLIKTIETSPKAVDGEIKTSLEVVPVTLTVATDKGAKLSGAATCRYIQQESLKNNYGAMIEFSDTNGSIHKQIFDRLATGSHTFFVGCSDVAGNTAFNQTTFSLTSDTIAPIIVRAYKDSSLQPAVFKIELNEDATCKDNPTSFDYEKEGNLMTEDGNVHVSASEPTNLYYVRCKDTFGNVMDNAQVQFA